MNFSTVPPWPSINARAISAYAVSIRSTSSGSAASDDAVNPTRSQNRQVTTFRSSRTDAEGSTASGAPQNGQNGNSPGNSFPQAGQLATKRVYGDYPTDNERPHTRKWAVKDSNLRPWD